MRIITSLIITGIILSVSFHAFAADNNLSRVEDSDINRYNQESLSASQIFKLIMDYPEATNEILRTYSLRGKVYEAPNFNPASDIISFSNFALDDVKRGRVANDINVLDRAERQSQRLEKIADNLQLDLSDSNLASLARTMDENNGVLTFDDLEKHNLNRAAVNNILNEMGWAHCFGMSYFVKQFHYKAKLINNSSTNSNILSKFKRICDRKTATFYGNSLWSLSDDHENDLMKAIVPLQKKLFFNPFSISLLLPHNQEKSLKAIRSELKKGKLVLIGLKKDLMWQHVVLGYRIEESSEGAFVYVYDSNYPTRSSQRGVKLVYRSSSKTFYSPEYHCTMDVFHIDR